MTKSDEARARIAGLKDALGMLATQRQMHPHADASRLYLDTCDAIGDEIRSIEIRERAALKARPVEEAIECAKQ